jgi:7-carboxy-7-deazaguanine synthase
MAVAYLSEVFSSVQGEGMEAGVPALFLRFAGCNLACSYCDTPEGRTKPPAFAVRRGSDTTMVTNPIECSELIGLAGSVSSWCRLVVLTGGEPLLQVSALGRLIPGLKGKGLRTFLETNGTLPGAMREVRDLVDFVSMDIKLPSGQGGRDLTREHLEFLEAVREGHSAVKIVIPGEAADREVLDALRLVAEAQPTVPVFLQPVFRNGRPDVAGDRLLRLQKEALALVNDVRLSVQMHKILGIR